MHPINSVKGAITTGVVLAIVIGIVLALWAGNPVAIHPVRADRWLHILSGVMWIGLLYYFNMVQTPGLAAAAADKGGPGGAGVTKYIAPRALLWFRWAAVFTWLTGAGYLMTGYGTGNTGAIDQRLYAAIRLPHDRHRRVARDDHAVQRLGSHLAEPEENPRYRAGDRRAEGGGAQDGRDGLAHQLHSVHPDDHVHGRAGARIAVLVESSPG